jgi:ABC-type multidrug transport system fused ATPase/permease subunit
MIRRKVTSGLMGLTCGYAPMRFGQHVALVPRKTWQDIRCSASENIRFGRPDASDEQVIAAAKAAVDEFITVLPEGLATAIWANAA